MLDTLFINFVTSNERGYFACVHSKSIDGAVMDVYGETPEQAEQRALQIIEACKHTSDCPTVAALKTRMVGNHNTDPVVSQALAFLQEDHSGDTE